MTNNTSPSDSTLRIRVLVHVFYDVCRCHVFTDPRLRCSRCDILVTAAQHWPYEYQLSVEAYQAEKAKGN